MPGYTRREFLKIGAMLAAGLGLARDSAVALADGLQSIYAGRKRVLWLQGMSCSGCSVSLLNSENPGAIEILTELISLRFHPTLSAAQGEQARQLIDEVVQAGSYYLVFEGALPSGMPKACMIGDRPMTALLPPILQRAEAVIAAGTCATFGGIPSAEGNLTQAVSVKEFMTQCGIPVEKRLINCAGCPVHPEALVSTLAYLAGKGFPHLDAELLTPSMVYGHSVHDDCPRFHYWQKQIFAKKFGDEGCLFNLGCLGPLSHNNCPRRQWNGGINWCIRAGAPCTACTSEHFAKLRSFPFYRKGEAYHPVTYRDSDRMGGQA